MAATAHSRALYYAQADKILPWRYCHVCKVGIEKVEAFCSFARRNQATLGRISFLDRKKSEPEDGTVLRTVDGLAIVHAIVWHFGRYTKVYPAMGTVNNDMVLFDRYPHVPGK